jgi:micrococcal nuclease
MRTCAEELLTREREARVARRGIWHSWAYRVQDAEDAKGLGRLTRTYQLVEGTVHAVGEGRKWLYVNFAEDWRHDFTIDIARKDLAAFESSGVDLERLAGKRVRVRGWVELVERTDDQGHASRADRGAGAGACTLTLHIRKWPDVCPAI